MRLNPMHLTIHNLFQERLFRIPEYQRAYSWSKKQRDNLFDDILEVKKNNSDHFMATVVTLARDTRKIESDEFKVVDIVDGQQRITTLIILFKAIEEYLNNYSEYDQLKLEISKLLIKKDEYNLILLQTNHDSSNIFVNYIKHGSVLNDDILVESDKNLLNAIKECRDFVSMWVSNYNIVDFLSILKNKFSIIYHEIFDEATVYRVFEVLNSRGLAVKWIDKTKSQLMAAIFEHVDESFRSDALKEMQNKWKNIYRIIGLDLRLGDDALRFAGTLKRSEKQNRILSEEDAFYEIVRLAGTDINSISNSASWLEVVTRKVSALRADVRRSAVIWVQHAKFLAVAVMLRNFQDDIERKVLEVLERVTFRIFSLGGADTRHKVGEYVRLAYEVTNSKMDADEIILAIKKLGSGAYEIDKVLSDDDKWEGWYGEWSELTRYILYRYDEYLSKKKGYLLNESQWNKIWSLEPSKSIEHIMPQSSGKSYIHHLGNLTMLPPGLNSSLGNKPPEEKADFYAECGLQDTMSIGRAIKKGVVWGEDSVIKRALEIEEFIRAEWAD